jgi:hypothetical protein
LTKEQKQDILEDFYKIKLSYENIIHKKVSGNSNNSTFDMEFDFAMIIPKGKKYISWFTFYNDEPVCLLMEIDNQNKKEIKHIKVVHCCFSYELSYGTIIYGTLFYYNNHPFFSIENIYYCKGIDITNEPFHMKMKQIGLLCKNNIQQVAYNNSFVVFGLPVMTSSNNELKEKLQSISYNIYSIQYVTCKNKQLFSILFRELDEYLTQIKEKTKPLISKSKSEEKIQTKIFICKPDIQNDVYHLYSYNDNPIGLACIPDYKTSVMMNKLFRKIKENDDLDALEESDDEEEFENVNIDKHVYLDKSYKMICQFNNKFKKWTPIKIVK